MYGTNTKGGISDLIYRLVSKEHILNSLQHTNGRTKLTDHMTLFVRWADEKIKEYWRAIKIGHSRVKCQHRVHKTKKKKNPMRYVLDTTLRKQAQMT